MEAPESGNTRMSGDTEGNISHFIHAVELKGSRAQKLQRLDTLIEYLERLRRSLAGTSSATDTNGRWERPGGYLGAPSWPWFSAGVVFGVVFVVLMLVAKSCS